MVQTVSNLAELNSLVDRADANRLIVIDFYADWCGPCHMIAPFFEQLAAQFGNATFLKVNVDHSRDIMSRYGVRAMPTFVLLKNKQEVDRIQGADQQRLQQSVQRHYSSTPANPNAANPIEKQFLDQFAAQSQRVKFYNDIVYKTLALSCIPEDRKWNELDEVALLEALVNWFKNEFFTWCDSPMCEHCKRQTPKNRGLQGTPTKEEVEMGVSRVEVYCCDQCNREVRFPRYNDPAKLLETRTGRCGEWANCFTLCAAAMGFEIRFIYDTTDHVWTEVFLNSQQRWIHVDPCEAAIDRPLLYEKGWKKKLSWVIGFGIDHVVDVTWRYVVDSRDVQRNRRFEVRPAVFGSFMKKLNERQMTTCAESRKKALTERRLRELIVLLVEEKSKKKESSTYGGRITGSKEWKENRGETGKKHLIQLPESLNQGDVFEFSYSCAQDLYVFSDGRKIEGLYGSVYETENIIRKVEQDWKMSYLCRGSSEKGSINWQIDLSSLPIPIKRIELRIGGCETFDKTAKTLVVACFGDTCNRFPRSGLLEFDSPQTIDRLKIEAFLSGGTGESAFQQAQLFRTSLENNSDFQLSVKIFL